MMRNILCQIDNQNSKDVMVHHERQTAIMLYRKNSSTSIEYCFGQRGKEYFGDPRWSARYLNEVADEIKDYTFINVLRDPTSRIISAVNQSADLIRRQYGCCVSANDFNELDKATDVHLMPQILTVPSEHNKNFLEKQIGGVYKSKGWPTGASTFKESTVCEMRQEYPFYPENWNALLVLIDAENTLLKEADNPKQVWFCATKSNNVVVDILKYLDYDILVNKKNVQRRNVAVAEQKGIEMYFSKTLVDKIEECYEYDYKLFHRVKFENM